MNPEQILPTVTDVGLRVGLQGLGALVFFIVGRRLIDFSVRVISGALTKQNVELLGATRAGPQFAVRPYANRVVAAAFGEAGYPAPVIAPRS